MQKGVLFPKMKNEKKSFWPISNFTVKIFHQIRNILNIVTCNKLYKQADGFDINLFMNKFDQRK